jgi:succinate dehydrogenase / fumarate reductase, cytochrome b subunit
MTSATLPRAFVWRRLHSLMGLWIVLFLCEHLFVNSQAALLLGDNGKGFIDAVNAIHNFPYLPAIECILLGVPIALHGIWGIKYLMTSKSNVWPSDGAKPKLNEYGRNWAYTWQRLTSWILLIGIILHVAKFRFIDYPDSLNQGIHSYYFVPLSVDNGLYTVAARLGVRLYSQEQITKERKELEERQGEQSLVVVAKTLPEKTSYDAQQQMILTAAQAYSRQMEWAQMLEKQKIGPGQVVAVAKDFASASLLTVRDTFKSPLYGVLYTVFVLAACFHAFNGLWTFCITWGVVLKVAAQQRLLRFSWGLMALVIFLGLAAIWGTYFLNLRS